MVGPAYDFLANPLGAVRSTFKKAIASGSDPVSFDGKDWGAVDLFRHFLVDQAGLCQVQPTPLFHNLITFDMLSLFYRIWQRCLFID